MLGNVCDCDFNMKFFNFYFVCIYCFLIISLAHGAVLYNSSEIKRIEDIPMRRGKAGSFNKFTKEQLLNTKFPHKISNDIDLDPCKSGKKTSFTWCCFNAVCIVIIFIVGKLNHYQNVKR